MISTCSAHAPANGQQETSPSNCNLPSSHFANGLTPVPATAVHYAAGLPERPGLDEGLDAYSAWLDAMCVHVRGMANKAGRMYHTARLAELDG